MCEQAGGPRPIDWHRWQFVQHYLNLPMTKTRGDGRNPVRDPTVARASCFAEDDMITPILIPDVDIQKTSSARRPMLLWKRKYPAKTNDSHSLGDCI
jgi:hypothetical protein